MSETLSTSLPDDVEEAVRHLLELACDREFKLVTAESCTGGLLATLFTDVPGCSHAFERGFVVYSNEAKHELLGVPEDLLSKEGAVSESVARAMAVGALARSQGDFSCAITGFAGAAGPDDEPGRVHFAVAGRGMPTLHRLERFGDVGRGQVRLHCMTVAIGMLEQAMRGKTGQYPVNRGVAVHR